MRKAAVVIGVNRTGGLPVLQSAARGAREVADWLEGEGFDVACLTDAQHDVTHIAVRDAVAGFVTRPARYHLLVMYFAGHGQWHSRVDHWLLSGAPDQPGEAVNLFSARDAASASGIPNVVFISDACRSIPDTVTGQRVEGSPVFPNYNLGDATKVDAFCATAVGQPAYEGPVEGIQRTLLTAALRSAFTTPDPDMVLDVELDGQPTRVVPNRRLEDYLQARVDELLASIDPRLEQRLQINVPSSDKFYMARVAAQPPTPQPAPMPQPDPAPPMSGAEPPANSDEPSRGEGAWAAARTADATVRSESNQRHFASGQRPGLARLRPSIEGRLRRRMPDMAHDRFESGTGFVVHGAVVAQAVWRAGLAGGALEALVLEAGTADGAAALVRVQGAGGDMNVPRQATGTLGLRLADGRCTLLAALPGYLAHVRVKGSGVADVNYVPTAFGFRWPDYEARRAELDRLRALVALATEHGTFRLASDREAQSFAERIRTAKALDPTLGLYAAYAYAQAGRDAWLVDVMRHMRDDLGADLFDVRLLASRHREAQPFGGAPMAPACPLLTQGWSLLATRGVTLPDALQRAGAYLCDSLWTSFMPPATEGVMRWLTEGEVE